MNLSKRKIIYIGAVFALFLSAILWAFVFWFISVERDEHKRAYLEKQTVSQKIAWDSTVSMHKVGMSAYFEAYIDKPDVAKLLTVANSGSEAQKAKARDAIHLLLTPVYAKLQDRNVKQLHFQDRENNSFFRFHQPHNFGDSLNSTRPSITIVNKYKVPVQGFEIGKVVSGFRNIFPIFNNGEHVGSVELSQPFDAIKSELNKLDGNRELMMILRASEILPKLFEENKKFYSRSVFSDDWLVEDSDRKMEGNKRKLSESSQKICIAIKYEQKFKEMLEIGKPFSYEMPYAGKKYTVTVVPVIDISGRYSAALLSFMQADELEKIESSFRMQLIYFSTMLLIAASALFWLLYSRKVISVERNRLSAISETMGEGMYVVDTEGRIEYINKAALMMLGMSNQECDGQIAHYLFHSHGKNNGSSADECPIYKTIQTAQKYEGVDHFRRKNGEIFTADIISSPLKDDDEIVGSVTVFRDITERVELEENLISLNEKLENRVDKEVQHRLESEAIFKVIFDKSPEGILIVDEKNVYKACNAAAANMLGYKQEEIIGKRSIDISPDIQPESGFFSGNATKMFAKNALDGATQHFEWTHIAKDGSYKLMEVMLSPIMWGEKKELLVIWRDITQIKELQKEKEASQALLIQQSKLAEMGGMIGAIAHQWKQPLNAIWIMTQDLKVSYDYGETTPELMNKFKMEMGEQVKFMNQTIEDFRNFYKPSTSKTRFELSIAIRSVLSLLKNQLAKEGVDLVAEFDDKVFVQGFESEFKQVILNIINNAREALDDEKKADKAIRLKVRQNGDVAIIEISDNAGGIDEKLLRDGKLFEPYNTTKGDSGTGVGMSLSKTIIEKKMGGKLSAENIKDGALFKIELFAFKAN